jgi:flagellum-specific ATP synthase
MLETIEQYRTNLDFYQNKIVAKGRLVRVSGLILEASGCKTELGGICSIKGDHEDMEAEVIGFEGDRIFMMPVGSMARLRPGAEVIPLEDKKIGVGVNYLGRILDGNGSPLDGKGEIQASETVSLFNSAINPLHRQPIREILDTGIGAINS